MNITKKLYDEMQQQIKNLQTEWSKCREELAKITEERDEANRSKDYYCNQNTEARSEIDRMQECLSLLPDPPPERPQGASEYTYHRMADRLLIWCARRMK